MENNKYPIDYNTKIARPLKKSVKSTKGKYAITRKQAGMFRSEDGYDMEN